MKFNKLSRRDLIKGLGAVGLLSATQVNRAIAQTGSAPLRVVFVALQHGWGTSARRMQPTDNGFTFPDGLDPFNAISHKCTVVDGVMTLGQWGNNHDLSYADMLTASVPWGEESSAFDSHMPLSLNPSIDYLLEKNSGKNAFRFSAGYRSWGVQHHPMSFDNNLSVLPYQTSAFDAYNSLFKDLGDSSAGNEQQLAEEAELLNRVFAFVKDPAGRQLDSLPEFEKSKLERYLLALEHLEQKNQTQVTNSGGESLKATPVRGQDRLTDLEHFLEMIKVGFANNMTSTAVLGIGDIHDIADFHQTHAHSRTETWWDTRREFSQMMVSFANALDSVIDFDGNTLLDNTMIVLTGEVGDGRHNIQNKGHIIIGGQSALGEGRLIQPVQLTGDDARRMLREDIKGVLHPQLAWSSQCSSRTNAHIMRELGNLTGLNMTQFGLLSQNRGEELVEP